MEEELHLYFDWKGGDLERVAQKLGRSMSAVTNRAKALKLGPPSQGTMGLREFMRWSGYTWSRIFYAVCALNLRLQRARRMDPRQKPRTHKYAITKKQAKAIVGFLEVHKRERFYYGTGKKTKAGVWGVGIKPPVCRECGNDKRPHYAKGFCSPCYQAQLKESRLQ